jgi:hypothetical protein
LKFLDGVELEKPRRLALDNYLRVLEAFNGLINEMEGILREIADINLLLTR